MVESTSSYRLIPFFILDYFILLVLTISCVSRHPIHLKPGVHSVLLRARSSGYFKFFCRLKPADQAPSFQTHPPVVPDLVNGRMFSNLISIPLTNHSPTKWLKITTLTLVSQTEGPDISLHLDKKQRLIVAPGQIHSVVATFAFKDDKKTSDSCSVKDIRGVLQLKSSEGFKDEISFTIRCRRSNQSFLFTFIDHDGSIQTAAAIFPIVTEEADSVKIYPVLLTLHSTGITLFMVSLDDHHFFTSQSMEKKPFLMILLCRYSSSGSRRCVQTEELGKGRVHIWS